MNEKIYVSEGLLCKEIEIDTLPVIADIVAADIMVRCAICEEHVSMNSHDYRAQGVFICDKCKAAVKHIRNILENGGSVI